MKSTLLKAVIFCFVAASLRLVTAQDEPVPAPTPPEEKPAATPALPPVGRMPVVPNSEAPAAASATNAVPPPAPAPQPVAQPTAPRKLTVGVIDFQGTPLQAVLEYYAQNLVKRSIISAPNLAGVVYFRAQTELTVDEARQALDSVLAINGIAAIPMGDKFLKVVQIATAKQEGLPFTGEGKQQPTADTLMTQVIPLKYAEATEIVGALQPYLHAYGQLLPLPKSSCLLITETAANVNQMLEIVKYIDQPSALRMETRVFLILHAKAGEVSQRLQSIIQETQQLGARASAPVSPTPVPQIPGRIMPQPRPAASTTGGAAEETVVEGKVIITPDERTNKIFILSRASNFAFFEKIIAELDTKVEPDVIMKVISLNYATAEDAASLVNALITGGTPTTTRRKTSSTTGRTGSVPPPPPVAAPAASAGAGAEGAGFLDFAEGVRILPDARTNSLLVMATKEDMARLEALIRSVDTSVAQVQIEVVIAEVSLNNELDVGVNIFKRLFEAGQTSQVGGNITDGNTPQNLASLGTNLVSAAGFASGLTYFTTFRNLKLDTVVRVLSTTSKGKVLSTPVIQTMDNQEANILVGESVPVPVSTVSSLVGGTGTLATGQLNANIEYKDVAIELKVTPRINPDGYVRMDIEQKVNDLGANVTISGTTVPTILKREAKSSVAVQDQSTIVLGGLIKENKTTTQTKVPFLGDIPFFGQIFKGQTNNKQRNELIIFIRPTVMRTDDAAVAEAHRRASLLKAGQELEIEKNFGRNPPTAPHSEMRGTVPTWVEPATASTGTPVKEPTQSERDTAKVKALERQTVTPN